MNNNNLNRSDENVKLNDKQKKILNFMIKEVDEKGYPPSVREICKALDIKSTSTVHRQLELLMKYGFILKNPSKPRAIKIINNAKAESKDMISSISSSMVNCNLFNKEIASVPIIGRVTAGKPILAVENIEDTFPVPVDFTQNATMFMLKVEGESMIEAGILDGDLVLVKQQHSAENGDIVVALIDDEATIKSFYKEKDYVRLQPQNPYMDPIIVKDNLSVLGKVVGVYRRL
ncbi:MAG TPA: transcriptional repressor LexA [Clostridiales bacterium]|nr:transcriptional repressor LexA [Clostridiales bacterium]